MPVEIVPALGWEKCARLSNAHAELLVTLDVGPRILSYKLNGGENVLRTFPDHLGKSGEPGFQVRGGHRLWPAPENERTYAPDNSPTVTELKQPNGVRAETPPAEPWQIRREMIVSLATDTSAVMIEHRLKNEGREPTSLASWGLTIMQPGGVEIIPQPPLGEHGAGNFLPSRALVLWSYTDLSDDRWRIGRRFITLQPKGGRKATKIGLPHRERWVAYLLPQSLFIKTFNYEDGLTYPDMGSNFETFTKDDFIELESLSPIKQLAPGESIAHTETWHLFGNTDASASTFAAQLTSLSAADPIDEAALAQWLAPYLSKIGIF